MFPFIVQLISGGLLQCHKKEMQIQLVYKTVLEHITLAMQSVFSSAVVRKTRHVILAMFDDLQGKDKLIETTDQSC